MNKSDLIEQLSCDLELPPKKAEQAINSILCCMVDAMKESKRIEIRGFGSFVLREYKPYVGRNPKTGEKIKVEAKKLPFFKTGKEMKERTDSK